MSTQNIPLSLTLIYPKYNNVCNYRISALGLKNKFEIAVVIEPLVFEPLKFYCNSVNIFCLSSD